MVSSASSSAGSGATVVATTMRALQRLPHELRSLVIEYVAGSVGWTIDCAAANGSLEDVQVLHYAAPSVPCSTRALDEAACHGDLATAQWLFEHRSEGCSQQAYYSATRHAHLAILQWLFEKVCAANDRAALEDGCLYYGIQHGHVSIVAWLLARRDPTVPLYNVFDHACRCGHLPVVQFLHAHYPPARGQCTTYAIDYAANNGHLAVVQWLHVHRTEGCSTDAMDFAAARGHLTTLQWLHQHRREGATRHALFNAIANGHIHVVEWLLRHNVVHLTPEMAVEALEYASYFGAAPIVMLLAQTLDTMAAAASRRERAGSTAAPPSASVLIS